MGSVWSTEEISVRSSAHFVFRHRVKLRNSQRWHNYTSDSLPHISVTNYWRDMGFFIVIIYVMSINNKGIGCSPVQHAKNSQTGRLCVFLLPDIFPQIDKMSPLHFTSYYKIQLYQVCQKKQLCYGHAW